MRIGNREFPIGEKTYVMGILNVTPDSFSDGGKNNQIENALKTVEHMVAQGADIIDVGGESTRPGYEKVSDEEEIRRITPVIQEIKKQFDIPVSVDTYKSAVAKAALESGADMLNDIWGFKMDEKMAELAAKWDVAVCLMHNNAKPPVEHCKPLAGRTAKPPVGRMDFMQEVIADLQISLSIAEKYGVKKEKIMLDPGIGFAKTYEENLFVTKHLEKIVALGYPVLLGTSRKSMIGLTLDLPVTEREEGTLATSVIGAMKGCSFVRVHDVEKNVRGLKMTDAILHAGE